MKRWLKTYTEHIWECRHQANWYILQNTRDIRTFTCTAQTSAQPTSTAHRCILPQTPPNKLTLSLISRQPTISKYFHRQSNPPHNPYSTNITTPHAHQSGPTPPSLPSHSSTAQSNPPLDQHTHRYALQTAITKYFTLNGEKTSYY